MQTVDLTRSQYDYAMFAVRAEGATLASVASAVRALNIASPGKVAELIMAGRVRILP